MEAPDALKAQIAELNGNLKALTTDLVPRVRAGEEAGQGVADLKAQIKSIVDRNSELSDSLATARGELQKRQDEFEIKMKEHAGATLGRASTRGIVQQSFKGLTSQTREKVEASIPTGTFLKAVTDLSGSAGDLLVSDYQPGILRPSERRLTIADLIMRGTTSGASITYMKELSSTDGAAVQATQGAAKGASDFVFDQVTVPVSTIAHYVKIARQMMDDVPALASYIDGRMRFLLDQKLEQQILNGTGSSGQLNGINTQATAFDATIDTTLGVTGQQNLDVLGVAAYQVSNSEFACDGFVINPREGWSLRLLKDSTFQYLFGNPGQGETTLRPWGIPAVETRAQAVDTFTAGAWQAGAQLFMRENAIARLATENEDDFIKNLVTLLVELRAALAVYRTTCFVKGTFTAAKA